MLNVDGMYDLKLVCLHSSVSFACLMRQARYALCWFTLAMDTRLTFGLFYIAAYHTKDLIVHCHG